MNNLFCYIYSSVLAPDHGPQCVPAIINTARRVNQECGITGFLVFDGWYFVQYLEGRESDVRSVLEKIRVDPRHVNFREMHEGRFSSPRRHADWHMAYASALDDHVLPQCMNELGECSVQRLHASMERFEFEPA